MGRAALRTADPTSGRSDQSPRKIGQVRRKRKKRKKEELEELRQDVLEAKRNLRFKAQQHKTWKTAYAKVLTNFADKRRESEDGNRNVIGAGKCGKRTKPRTICDRLLPELVGMYKNGAKGREILRVRECQNETNATARLRGDVLKLLNGDETNPKSTREQRGENEARRETRFPAVRSSDESDADESDCEIENGKIVRAIRTRRTKGVVKKLANRESKRRKERGNDGTSEAKDQLTERVVHRQRDEDKCRRRLFEPDDGVDENSFGIIDRTGEITDEIRFSPSRRASVLLADKLKKPKDSSEKGAEGLEKASGNDRNENESKAVTIFDSTNDNHWGWSPTSCYENLCAMTCVQNFENDRRRYKVPERSLKIRKILRGFYLENLRQSRSNPREGSKTKSLFSRQTDHSVFSDDSNAKVGSWHAEYFTGSCNREDSKFLQDDIKMRKEKKSDESPPINNNGADRRSTNDTIWKTIDSVSRFLETFEQCDSSNGKDDSFADQIARASAKVDEEKMNVLNVPTRDLTFDENRKILVRRNTRHVPTILRRSTCRTGVGETRDEKPSRPVEKRRGSSDASTLPAVSKSTTSIPSTKDDSILSPLSIFTPRTPRAPPIARDEKILDDGGAKITRKLKLNFIGGNYEPNGDKVAENKPVNLDGSIYRNRVEAENCRINVPIHRQTDGNNVTFIEFNENLVTQHRRDNCESSSRLVSEFPTGVVEDLNQNLYHHRHHQKTKECVDENVMKNLNEPISRFSSFDPTTLFARADLQDCPNQNRRFQSFDAFRGNEDPSYDYRIVKSELADQGILRPPEQRPFLKKPVVLFRPNVEKSRQEARTSNHQFHGKIESIAMRDAVRNLRATIFQENSKELLARADDRRYQEQQQAQQTPGNDFHPTQNRASREDEIFAVNQPTKFVALERTNGTNPRRVPIFINSDRASVPAATNNNEHRGSTDILTIVDNQSKPGGMIYVRSHERPDNTRERETANAQLARHTQHLDGNRTYRVSGYRQPCNYYSNDNDLLVLAHLPPVNFHPATDNVFPTTASSHPAWSNDVSGISNGAIDRQRLAANVHPARTRYERVEPTSKPVLVPTSVYTHNPPARYEIETNVSRNYQESNDNLPKRIRLSDGTIALVIDNDLTERLDIDPRLDSNLARTDLPDEKICSRPVYRWNPVYNAAEEYPPHRLASNAVSNDYII